MLLVIVYHLDTFAKSLIVDMDASNIKESRFIKVFT